jgi:hypothetical protein
MSDFAQSGMLLVTGRVMKAAEFAGDERCEMNGRAIFQIETHGLQAGGRLKVESSRKRLVT